ncbi:cyclic nucleotide-binding domain-containing protein 2-like [Dreissena polymorpha]|uniref:Cyclic nucleotide-binding domain-containing protein n=1 Tax=Dreissena polymorpha TaxID=45954 RepID=A0A9D4KJ40_DREPO|nr:cyclic nucleotide-binding domain-containing protein 2-like [Dreissena polymorpha]KAH3840803.1 hypothetical protein DPMN_114259 [Dreissena polymorpha]
MSVPAPLTSGKHDPAATDLDYYAKPENYTGSNLQSLQRFKSDKTKEEKAKKRKEKKKVIKDAKYCFFRQYRHILKNVIFIDELVDREQDEDSEEEDDDDEAIDQEVANAGAKAGEHLAPISEEKHGDDKNRRSSPESDGRKTPGSAKRDYRTPSPGEKQAAASQRLQGSKVAKELRNKQLRDKFIMYIKGIRAICRLSATLRKQQPTSGMSGMKTFIDMASETPSTEQSMKNAGLSFDPSIFKAKKEISLSTETKSILTTDPAERTPEQVQTAMFGLQCLRSYAEYPLHMQEKLAKVAWYEVVAPKRIIIRQGHIAENFYFVLSGHAVVTILLKDAKTGASFVKTATVMKQGMSFGELALLHHSKRTATVTTQDTVQLLSIGRDDFFDIFMSGDGNDEMPQHIRFISNLDFMKDWPIHELVEHPEHCLLHFYKRNMTIVANSNDSDWLYIVKSGSCVVMKKLKGVIPNANAKPKVAYDEFLPANMKAIVYAPKVDSGLRRKKRRTTEKDKSSGPPRPEKFSKGAYSQHPHTKSAHFAPAKSSFAKRKRYEPPRRCIPKKPEVPETKPVPVTKPGPVFVQVTLMKPRDVFGLDTVTFEDGLQRSTTVVSLVSRGAECIMLSKEFFVKHANEAVKKRIREDVRAYPEEEVFQDNLQIKEDWTLYKKVLLGDVTSQIAENKKLDQATNHCTK